MPPTEKRGRVHTSSVTVSVLFQNTMTEEYPDSDFDVRFHRGTGKGGQKRNKVASCCVVTHLPSGLTQKADGRSRIDNETSAKERLIEELKRLHSQDANTEMNKIRQSQIGIGGREEKRRTYRFQEDMIYDHISGKSMGCKKFMRGDIDRLWR